MIRVHIKKRHELRENSYWMAGASQMNLRQ